MEIKPIISRLLFVFSNPAEAWETLSEPKEDSEQEDIHILKVLLIFNAVSTFLGAWFWGNYSFISILLKGIFSGLSFFCAFWLSYYLLTNILYKKRGISSSRICSIRLLVYSFAFDLILSSIIALFPELMFLYVLVFYTIYIVWEGVGTLLNVDEQNRISFALWLSVIVIATPKIIDFILDFLIPKAAI